MQEKPLPLEAVHVAEAPAALPSGDYDIAWPGQAASARAQVFTDQGRQRIACILPANLKNGDYALRRATKTDSHSAGGVQLVPEGRNIRINMDGALFTVYRIDEGAKPFLFPLIGPTGAPYTRAYPMETVAGEDHDHPHQRSFWFTHGNVNGVDFWSEQGNHGRIVESSRSAVVSGPVLGRLRTTDDWLSPGGKRVCRDERVLTVSRVGEARVLDFDITLTASDGPLTFGDTKEGMFGVRVASSMDVNKRKGGRILNAEGLSDDRAWGKASCWVDYVGPVAGKLAGIAILNDPRSFRFPTTWHVRTYGLFAANPFGWHDFGLGKSGEHIVPAGREVHFGYRVILHEGTTAAARVAEQFAALANPPRVEVEAASGPGE